MVSKSTVNGYLRYMEVLVLDTFLSVTFRQLLNADEAIGKFKGLLKRLNTPEHQFYDKVIRGFVVAERQGRKESVHLHCVMQGVFPDMVPLLGRRCLDDFGDTDAQIYNYGLPGQASLYIARKCAEGTAEGWTPFKINSKWRG